MSFPAAAVTAGAEPGGEEEPPPADTAADTAAWRAATDRLREVIKWVAVSFGALGALLIGTAPLSSVAQAKFGLEWGIAIVSGVAALLAVGLIFWQAITLLSPNPLVLSQLVTPDVTGGASGWRERLKREALVVGRAMTPDQRQRLSEAVTHDHADLLGSYGQDLVGFIQARDASRKSLAVFDEQWQREYGNLTEPQRENLIATRTKMQTSLVYSGQVRARVLAWAENWVLRDNFDQARTRMFLAAVVAALGITAFHIGARAAVPIQETCTSTTTETTTTATTETTVTESMSAKCFVPSTQDDSGNSEN